MDEPAEKIQADSAVSRIWSRMRRMFPPAFALAVLAIVGAQLQATTSMRTKLDEILQRGIVQSSPQEAISEWKSLPGIRSRIVTPRNPRDSDADHAARHADAVRALTEAFTPVIEED